MTSCIPFTTLRRGALWLAGLSLAAQAAQLPPDLNAAFFAGDARKIITDCTDQAFKIKFKDSRLLAEYGRSYLAAGARARAEEMFAKALWLDAKDPGTRFLIGWAWLKNGFRQEAVAAFEGMVQASPKCKNWATKAASCLVGAGLETEAARFMEVAYRQDPKDWQNCIIFARAALGAQQRDLAAAWFLRALKADPKDECIWNDVALAYADGGGVKVE